MLARWGGVVLCLVAGCSGSGEPIRIKYVPLPKGTFFMGGGGGKSGKQTEIKEDFEIANYPVTQGQWEELMGNNPSFFSREGGGKEKVKDIKDANLKHFPVEQVSWEDVQEFLKKLNEKEKGKGYVYRLPTEEEWEYACRAGATTEQECSYHFYFAEPSNEISSNQANFNGNYPSSPGPGAELGPQDKRGPYLDRTTKVGSYAPNKLGLHDMHGNVWQWTDSHWAEEGSGRVVRGGGWWFGGGSCQAGLRLREAPTLRGKLVGFRLVRVPIH